MGISFSRQKPLDLTKFLVLSPSLQLNFCINPFKYENIFCKQKRVWKISSYDRRKLIAPDHTCTHMLNFALREVLGKHVDQKGSTVLPEKLRFDFSHGKPIHPDHLRRIESIVNDQIEDELDVYRKEATLADAKRINGVRAVFGEFVVDAKVQSIFYTSWFLGLPLPVRVLTIGQKVEDLLADPDNEEWLSVSAELCGGTHISNTREAKAFALLSEEGIAKGIRRITAVTTDRAFKAMELAFSLELEVDAASEAEGSLLEKKVASLRSRVDAAPISAPKKADLRTKISLLQDQVRKEQKKIAEENIQKAVKVATEMADGAASDGKAFCISLVDVGLDTTAVREAVLKVIEQKGISVTVFSTDETTNKAVVYAGVPENGEKFKQLEGCGNKVCINETELIDGTAVFRYNAMQSCLMQKQRERLAMTLVDKEMEFYIDSLTRVDYLSNQRMSVVFCTLDLMPSISLSPFFKEPQFKLCCPTPSQCLPSLDPGIVVPSSRLPKGLKLR
ncbi:hypothetical protein PVL29_020533 [Vitis rotundifolia]|uniref:alanine--tRNA ligase n=1 Tax=Vitis rotundifolia TaxID=103349 RepID=A0AA39DC65_VITRO|nr:hypothetical protein PVL29_020533 [Vitis rotundifolia]